MPKVSILTPVFNGAEFVGEAIASVANSEFEDYEHVIVDDGSTDTSREVIQQTIKKLPPNRSSKVKFFTKSNSGEADTDNFALARSSGEYLIVLNADDLVSPNLIGRMVNAMDQNPSVSVSYPDWIMINDKGHEIKKVETRDFALERLIGKFECIPGPGACIRRDHVMDGILRDPTYSLISDYECWQRLSLRGDFLRVPEFLAFWRLHGENASITSRGLVWAHQAIGLANNFYRGAEVKGSKRLKLLAQQGLSKSYLLGALQGAWDPNVPSVQFLGKALIHGILSGRKIEMEDLEIIAQVAYGKLTRARDQVLGKKKKFS